MLQITPQERLALAVTALLLSAGAGVRVLGDPELLASGRRTPAAEGGALLPSGEAEAKVEEARQRSRPLAAGERIDPNTASAIELQRLPRVGPALAARIVAHREASGPFRSLADLDAVPGIGPAMLRTLEPLVALPAAPSKLAELEPPAGSGGSGRGRAAAADPLDVNRASVEELQSLPGIGPVIAARIVAWRDANGPFRSTKDLEKVSGIGPKLRERLESRVRVGP